ncbi:MAG: hypothetical protein JNL70_26440 [Saprospiraceae bacterium]|nr:hypothetical protein [Saprospiraceae bacterium]
MSATKNYESLLKDYEQAQAQLERARLREKAAKKNLKTAEKREDSKLEIEISRLELIIAKAKRKARKAGAAIAKIQIKQWIKANAKGNEKAYQLTLVEAESDATQETESKPKRKYTRRDKSDESTARDLEASPETAEGKAGSYVSTETETRELMVEPEKKQRRTRRSSADAAAEREAKQAELRASGDDFTIIEGIGPAVTKQLHEMGINTFTALAQSDLESIKTMLKQRRNNIADPTTWAQQAQLILNNEFESLRELQETLRKKRS